MSSHKAREFFLKWQGRRRHGRGSQLGHVDRRKIRRLLGTAKKVVLRELRPKERGEEGGKYRSVIKSNPEDVVLMNAVIYLPVPDSSAPKFVKIAALGH